jgi:hypothetical protein
MLRSFVILIGIACTSVLIGAAPASAATLSWQEEPYSPYDLPYPIVEVGATTANDRVVVAGGRQCNPDDYYCEAGVTPEAWAWSPASFQWTRLADMHMARYRFGMARGGDGRVYAIGGITDAGGTTNRVEAYSFATDTWVGVAPFPVSAGALHAATGNDGQIYVFGAGNVRGYTPSTNTWATVAGTNPGAQAYAAATAANGTIVVAFGWAASPQVRRYNPTSKTWTALPTLTYWQETGTPGLAISPHGTIFLLGGNRKYSARNWVLALAPGQSKWTPAMYLTEDQCRITGVTGPDGDIYALGGSACDSDDPCCGGSAWQHLATDDVTPPSMVTPPTPSFVTGTQVNVANGTLPVTLNWVTTDNTGPYSTYLEQKRGSGAWQPQYDTAANLPYFISGISSLVKYPVTGTTYQYRATPGDGLGTLGDLATGPVWKVQVRQEVAASITYSAGWSPGTSATAFGGGTEFTSTAGATATSSFTGRAVTWIAPLGPGKGSAKVSIDGTVVATVNLNSTTAQAQQLVFTRNFAQSGTHTIKITAVGGARIDLDALAIIT